MKLIFIHGPAASGKLTVARALSELTGLAVFHNHLVVDALLEKLPFGDPEFVRLREAMWMAAFETAAKAGTSLIFTFAPGANSRPRVSRAGVRSDRRRRRPSEVREADAVRRGTG